MNKKYKSLNRNTTRLRYHIVLSFKYKYKVAQRIGDDNVKSIIDSAISRCKGVKLLSVGIDKNHVHMVIDSPPYWSVSQLVDRIKQLYTHRAWMKYSPILKQFFWRKKVLFSDGYFCESIGNVEENVIINYVKNQGKK